MVHSRVEITKLQRQRREQSVPSFRRRFWKEVQWLRRPPSTRDFAAPDDKSVLGKSNFDAFEQFGDALTQALQSATESKVEGLGFEGQIQLVFFHPQYVFRNRPVCAARIKSRADSSRR